MKFIHTADLHLDSPFLGLQHTPAKIKKDIMQSTFAAFKKIVSNAISTHIDFIVIAGDIYDRDSHSVQAENFFIQQCELLQKNSIDVYLSYGNHDYQIVNYDKSLLPNNVHVFGNQVETKTFTTTDGTKVAITGFSYQTQQQATAQSQIELDEDLKQYIAEQPDTPASDSAGSVRA